MRSYRVAESPLDRARGVVRIERLDYPATTSSRAREAQEYRIGLAEVLGADGVHVYRQLMRADGATREFLIDVDGPGLQIVESHDGDARASRLRAPATSTRPVRPPDSGLVASPADQIVRASPLPGDASTLRRPPRPGRGLEPGQRRTP